jgi:gamma-butyrobetaine dioxygenase
MSSSDAGIYKWLKQLNHYGMSLITDIPHGKDIVEICSVVGDPQPHAYLSVFDVVASPDIPPVDAAYSTDDLIIHSDQNYLESPPGIQILHCLKFDECVDGGLTMLVDAYNELNILRRDHPQHFKALASIPYSMHRIHDNTSELKLSNNWRLSYTRPHVSLDRHGRVWFYILVTLHNECVDCWI